MFFFFFKQKTAYEVRISDWSSDVCSSDLDLVLGLVVIACEHPGAAGIVRAIDDGGAYVGLCSSDVVFVPTGLGTEIRALEWLCRGGGGNCSGSSGQRERDGEKIAVHETCLSWVSFLVPGEIVAADRKSTRLNSSH